MLMLAVFKIIKNRFRGEKKERAGTKGDRIVIRILGNGPNLCQLGDSKRKSNGKGIKSIKFCLTWNFFSWNLDDRFGCFSCFSRFSPAGFGHQEKYSGPGLIPSGNLNFLGKLRTNEQIERARNLQVWRYFTWVCKTQRKICNMEIFPSRLTQPWSVICSLGPMPYHLFDSKSRTKKGLLNKIKQFS